MNSVLEALLTTGYAKSADGTLVKLHSHIDRPKGDLLQSLIHMFRPARTLEVGLAFGISSLYICEAIQDSHQARHVIIDPAQMSDQYWKGLGLENLRSAGYGDMIEFMELPSHL